MRWKLRAVLLCCLVMFIAIGCSVEQQKPLRIGICLWPGYEPFFLARDLGLYDDLPITIVEYPSPSGAARAMKSGTIDAVALTLDEVLLLIDDGVKAQVVLVTDVSNGGDVIVARPPITGVEQLKGKTIISESTGLASYMLNRALDLHGLLPSDVNSVFLPMSEHLRAYQQDDIDALITFEPAKTHLLNAGAKEIFSSADIPDEVVDVLTVRQSYIDLHPEIVRGLIDGWYQALQFFENNSDTAAEMISVRLKITPQEVLDSYRGMELPPREEVSKLLGSETMEILPVAERLQQAMLQHNLLYERSDLEAIFTDQLLQ